MIPEELAYLTRHHAWSPAYLPTLEKVLGGDAMRPTEVQAMLANPDGESLWVASEDSLYHWNVKTGALLGRFLSIVARRTPGATGTVIGALSFYEGALYVFSYGHVFQIDRITGDRRETLLSWSGSSYGVQLLPSGAALINVMNQTLLWRPSLPKKYIELPARSPGGYLFADGDRYLRHSQGVLRAYLSSGDIELWSVAMGSPQHLHILSESLVLAALQEGGLVAISLEDGHTRWRRDEASKDSSLAVSPDAAWVAYADNQGIVVLRANGEEYARNNARASSIALAPDGSWLAAYESHSMIKIYDLPSGAERPLGGGHSSQICGLQWMDADHLLSCATSDQQLRRWSATTSAAHHIELPRSGATSLRYLPDGSGVLIGFSDGDVSAYELEWGASFWSAAAPGKLYGLLLSPDGATAYVIKSSISAWRIGEESPRWVMTPPEITALCSSCLSADGARLILFYQRAIYQYDTASGALLQEKLSPFGEAIMRGLVLDDRRAFCAVEANLTDGYGGEIWAMSSFVWSLTEGKVLAEGWPYSGVSVRFLLQREEMILLIDSGKIYFYQGEERQPQNIDLSGYTITSAALSPDQKRLALGTSQGAIMIFVYQ